MSEDTILMKIGDCVVNGDRDAVLSAIRQAIDMGITPIKIVNDGLSKGMKIVGDKYEDCEYYLPDVIVSAQTMYAGVDMVKPLIKVDPSKVQAKIVMGTIEGDVHDIGKNLVKLMFIGAGWEVFDLGNDVPLGSFIKSARENGADLIATSALMTTSMLHMKDLVAEVRSSDLGDRVGIIIGGAPVSEEYAKEIGADGYAPDAVKAVHVGERIILGMKR
jgi:5-methyltetrahydrofolate--homocysteine methyltransferase